MENAKALRWAAVYLGLWVLAGVVGLAIAGVGLWIGALSGTGLSSYAPVAPTGPRYPVAGRVLAVLGLLVWKFGSAAGFLETVTDAFGAETERQLDTEGVKSEVLRVLDDRLSEMHREVTRTRRLVDRLGRDDDAPEFEFEETSD